MSNSDISIFRPGQRWVSEAEPELGLGMVLQLDGRRLTMDFSATGDVRTYMAASAPLNRVRYTPGDTVTDGKQISFTVETVTQENDLLLYHGEGQTLHEGELSDLLVFNRPQDRILNDTVDDGMMFALRQQVLMEMHRYAASPLRGLLGGRLSLIPHQLYVVESVVNRVTPRVLLADEIGLGKTIEACLILHRKLMLGQITRALILVPSVLIHQWFVELLRRFALKVAIYDEERCEALKSSIENPFLDEQLVLCNVDWLADSPQHARQAVEAGWDLLIVDEAHHLEWTPGQPSKSYAMVEVLAQKSKSVLLLTATPEEMGGAGHFARLRLLDPDRYSTLEQFQKDQADYDKLVPLAEALQKNKPLTKNHKEQLKYLGLDPSAHHETLIRELVDCYGPGRVIFRNTRHIIKGFPKRHVHLIPLKHEPDALLKWFIKRVQELAPEKVFALVHTQQAALAFYHQLKETTGLSIGVFHEEMNLIQRDRQAAWFADPAGARILISSEIGGEGRNFQFAHHLVMLDVPLNPEIIEQRIGRLDRIGQQQDIHLHIPYVKGTADETNARWLHEGLNVFHHSLPGAHEIYTRFRDTLEPHTVKPGTAKWRSFIQDVKKECADISERVLHGRDRLLELQSYRADEARQWVEAIQKQDKDTHLEAFLLTLFEAYGIHPEVMDSRCWQIKPDALFTDSIPGFPREGMIITFDRAYALSRDDVGFVTWDHPLVQGAMERMITSPDGNAAIAIWPNSSKKQLLVDATFILQVAASGNEASRFLPPTPIHICLDGKGTTWPHQKPDPTELTYLTTLTDTERMALREILPTLLQKAETLAQEQAHDIRSTARQHLEQIEQAELQRLKTLQQRNHHITDQEISEKALALIESIQNLETASIRLDTLRYIICP